MTKAPTKSTGLFTSWWFGDALLLGLCTVVVAAAVLLTPTPEFVEFFGWRVPEACGFRRMTGYGCPGCGLTRSFTFMAHFSPIQALKMNPIGPPFFLFVAVQVPYRLLRLVRGARKL